MSIWTYRAEDCDVLNQELLVRYRDCAASWDELLHGDEEHSVSGQFSDMLWQDAAWRSLNEARKFHSSEAPSSAVAPLLGGLLDRGYISSQVLSISRLLERSNPKRPTRGVVSLRRIVEEIVENQELFTREIFVSHDGLPYDWEAAGRRFYSEFEEEDASIARMHPIDNAGPNAWYSSKQRHELFDRLAGVSFPEPNRSDKLGTSIFERLEATFNEPVFGEILNLRNKVVAHAADAFSRSHAASRRRGLKLDEIARAHYLLIGLFQTISACLLYGSWRGSAVPVPQDNQFNHLDKVFVPPEQMNSLHEFWQAHCEERDNWLSKAFHEFVPE